MQEEIKNILKCLEMDMLDNKQIEILLDYITNLQKEIEELREDNYAYRQLMKMQNEREYRSKFLKEFQEEFGKNVFPDYDEIYKRYDKLKKENKRLNNIINKAIEYIEKYLQEHIIDEYPDEQSTFYDEKDRFIPNAKEQLLDILKGVDKE